MDDKEPRKVDIGAPLSVETIYQLAILAVVFLLTACSNDPGASQPTQKAVAVAEPTEVPTLVASPLPTVPPTERPMALPTEVPAETPTEVPTPLPTHVPTATPEDPELNRKFGAAVQDYVRKSWGGWDEGEFIGQCLIDNATSITATAREAVIQHGVDDAFSAVSGNDLASLSTAWDLCEREAASANEESDLPEESDDLATVAETSNPELDKAFSTAVEDFIDTTWAGWSDGVLLGNCLAANASQISSPAKQGVIDYGLDEVYDHISQTASYSLGMVWDDCEEQIASGTGDSGISDQSGGSGDSGFSDQSGETAVAPIGSVRTCIEFEMPERVEVPCSEPTKLLANCTLYAEQLKVSCQASGYTEGPMLQLSWNSTATWFWHGGDLWEFDIERLPYPEIRVYLEECQGFSDGDVGRGACQAVETLIDASEVDVSALLSEDTSDLERIELSAPFDPNDGISDLNPMGETIYHPITLQNPYGHGGLDLLWESEEGQRDSDPNILAAATGRVSRVWESSWHGGGTLVVELVHEGFDKPYYTGYGGIIVDLGPEIGDTIQKGEVIGPVHATPTGSGYLNMIHWDFGYFIKPEDDGTVRSLWATKRRLCPMSYFEEASRSAVEEVWEASTNEFKEPFPYICSGDYHSREE